MSMSKKDYELIAQTSREFRRDLSAEFSYNSTVQQNMLKHQGRFVARLGEALKADNERFDLERFLEAALDHEEPSVVKLAKGAGLVEADLIEAGPHLTYLGAKYDNLFKAIITAGWNVKSDGAVDAPTGFFAVVEIPSHEGELEQMKDAVDPDGDLTWGDDLQPGWYFTYEDDLGFIHVYKAASKHFAEVAYADAEKQYSEWQDVIDEG